MYTYDTVGRNKSGDESIKNVNERKEKQTHEVRSSALSETD